jgi:dihydrodipicolinate synthase/N-acetylneuraminate lyase
VRAYYDAVTSAAGGLPVLAYHWPSASAPGISIEQLADLPVAALKDSTGDVARLQAEMDAFPGAIYAGSQAILTAAAHLGARGAILGIANAEPELAIRAWAGESEAQREVQRIAVCIKQGLVGGLKQHMAARYATSAVVRMA